MLPFLLAAAITLSGHVVDRDGHAVAGASVTLVEAKLAVRSGADGSFSFPDVPPGSYTIVARSPGFASAAQRVESGQASSGITLTLVPATLRAEPITVTATRSAESPLLSPMPTSVLSGDRVHREAGMSLAHSLAALPGVRDVSTGLQIGKPMVRGLYGARVLVLHDGSRLEDYSWSEEDGPSIDSRLAERVEVIRGPGSVLYGSDALGGVVNVIPEELPYSLGGAPTYHATAETYFQSNNLELGGYAKLQGTRGRMGWRVNGTGRFAQSYGTPAGDVEHTGFLSANFDGAVAFHAPAHSATVRFSHYGGEFKLLEANRTTPPPAGAAEEGPERVLLDDRIQISGNHLLGGLRLETRAQFQRHALQEKSDECVPPPGQTTCAPPPPGQEAIAFDLLLNTGTMDALVHHTIGARTKGTVGVSGMFQGSASSGPIYLIPNGTTLAGAAMAMEEISFGKVHLMGSARVDARKLDVDANTQLANTDDSRSWNAAIGHAGVVINPVPSIAFTTSVGMGWRAPTLFDLYANGPHLAENRYEKGDARMAKERALDFDAGVRWSSRRVRADVSVFRNAIDNYIYLQPTTATQNGLQVFQHVQDDALTQGAEALIEAAVAEPLTLRAQHDVVRGEHRANGAPLPLMPPARTVVGFELHSTHRGWARRAAVGVELENVAKQTRRDPSDYATDAYSLINLDFEVERNVAGRPVRLDLDVRNATNAKYKDFLSRYKQFAFNPGLNVIFRLATEF